MKKDKNKHALIVVILVILLLGVMLVSLLLGRFSISVRECLGILASKIFPVEPYWTQVQDNMLWLVRVPRIGIAVLVGMALSVAGTSYQCIFRNPMAAPDILGASTGAAFGAALAILMGRSNTEITAWAFLSSIACVALVLLCAKICRGNPIVNLVLAGIMIGSLFSASTSYLKLIADPHNTLPAITYWMMGSIAGANMAKLQYVWIPMLIALVPIVVLRWKINLLTMDDEEAKTMGINTGRVRVIVIICATLLTAASVSVSGMIGWVGLVIPHLARRMVGNDCRILIPTAGLTGGIFLLLVDDVARNLYTTELPLGILTAFVGAPFFIYLMARKGAVS
jgi:iron complex transport system permease protein